MIFNSLKEDFDGYLALIGALLSILLIIYLALFIGRLIYILAGFVVLSPCIIWIVIRKKADLGEISHKYNSFIANFSNLLSYFFISASILALYLNNSLYVRPLEYFIFISLAVCMIAFEIVYFRKNKKLTYSILFKIIMIGISLELSQELIFPSLVGIDPWYHQSFTTTILSLAHIPSGSNYSDFPFFHLIMASIMLMTGTSYKNSSMLVGICQVILIALFLFLIGKNAFPKYYSTRLGLLAALLVTTANYVIQLSFWTIPNALGWVFTIMIIYLLFVHKNYGQNKKYIMMIAMGALIFTHTLSAFGLAMLLTIGWIIYYFHLRLHINIKSVQFPQNLTIFFIISMFSLWMYAYWPLNTLVNLVLSGFNQNFFTSLNSGGIIALTVNIPTIEQILNQIPVFLFFTLSFIGIFYMISKKYGNCFTRIIAIMGVVPLAISFFILIGGGSILGGRWWSLAEDICSISASIPFLLIFKIKTKPVKIVLFASLIIFLSFFMIINLISNIDNNTFSPNSTIRYVLTNSELQSLSFLFSKWNGPFATDQYYGGAVISNLGQPVLAIDQELYDKKFTNVPANTLILIRSEIVSSPIMFFNGIYLLNYNPCTLLQTPDFDKIYDCNSVSGFLR